jgi:[protein-PII] uridylyltransferase
VIALRAAHEVDHALPDRSLLEWLTQLPERAFTWDRESSDALFELLRSGGPRAWRFLYTTGVLERALPELADAIALRRADPYLYDPNGELQWELVDAVHRFLEEAPETITRHVHHPEWLVLAALVLDVTSGDVEVGRDVARTIAQRLDLPREAHSEIDVLVGDHGLLFAASRRVDAFTEASIEQLAIRLRHREGAASLYVLTSCYFELEEIDRQRLAQLWMMLDKLLSTYESGTPELGDILQHRRDQALALVGDDLLAQRRINTGPMAWLLSADPDSLARQAKEIYPVPSEQDPRVFAVPDDARLDVVCRDRPGLLAAVTGALESLSADIISATAATWPDGMALSTFRLRGNAVLDDVEDIRLRIDMYLSAPATETDGIVDAVVGADNESSPWYTVLTVEADDQAGLLHAITAAIAHAGACIHSARISTSAAGRAVDVFDITDLAGSKVPPERVDAIVTTIHAGISPTTTRRRALIRAARGER